MNAINPDILKGVVNLMEILLAAMAWGWIALIAITCLSLAWKIKKKRSG